MGKAGTATRSEDSTFAKLDKNHDGYISKVEAMGDAKLKKDFASFDLNNDGKLNRAEYLAAAAKEDTGKLVDKASDKMNNKDSKASTGSSTSTSKSSTK
jgi:Ca2+-binding EF-hand superfamily protein